MVQNLILQQLHKGELQSWKTLKKAKEEADTIQYNLKKRLNTAETIVEYQQSQMQDQQSQIQALNSQMDIVMACQQEMFKKMQFLGRSSPSSGH